MNKLKLVKQDKRIPDFFGVKITYLTGEVEKLEVATRHYGEGMLSLCTKENQWVDIILSNTLNIKWDDNYSKFIDVNEQLKKEKEGKEKNK